MVGPDKAKIWARRGEGHVHGLIRLALRGPAALVHSSPFTEAVVVKLV